MEGRDSSRAPAPTGDPILTRLAHEGPQRGKYYLELGLALVTAKDPEEAVAPPTRAVELTQGRPRYLDALRDVLTKLGREKEMEELEKRYRKGRPGG
jgi:hypothetical protein